MLDEPTPAARPAATLAPASGVVAKPASEPPPSERKSDPDAEVTYPGLEPASAKPFDAETTVPMRRKGPIDPEVTDTSGLSPAVVRQALAADPLTPVSETLPTQGAAEESASFNPAMILEGSGPSIAGEEPLVVSAPPAALAPPVSDPAYLCVTRGPGAGTSVSIPEGEHPIGRSDTCFLCIAHPSLSREHTLLKRVGNRFYVRDANSNRGTLLNGVRIQSTCEVIPGDQLVLGDAVLVLRHGPVIGPEFTMPGAVATTPPKRSPALLWLGIAATILGGAALASVLLTPMGERLFRGRPAAPAASASPTLAAPTPPTPPVAVAPPPSDINLVDEIVVKPTVAHDDLPIQLAELAPAKPSGPDRRPHRPLAVGPAAAGSPAEPGPRPAHAAVSATEAIRLFNENKVDEAISVARRAGSSSLLSKLTAFKREAGLGQADLSFQDGAGAIRHFSAAAAIDEDLTRGWSTPGARVRSELTQLLIVAGEQALAQGNAGQAVTLLDKALFYGPGNEKAERLLQDARGKKDSSPSAPKDEAVPSPAPEPAPTPSPEAPAPPEPRPRKPVSNKESRSAADKAFGD
ncbi:MAG: FHA domain-containing protein [Deltaproteobacteria bacterium]|nr:FHA domain-containing protein [Deltaproteobacteria bacterium]